MDIDNLKYVAEAKLRAWREREPGTEDPNVIIRARDAINLVDEASALRCQRDQLREALSYAVDNPEFNSEEFDAIARAALKATEEG